MDQIIDKKTVAIPGPIGTVTPQVQALHDETKVWRDQTEAFAGQTQALQDEAVSTLLTNPNTASGAIIAHNPLLRITDFGAVGDGDTDCHDAIQRCIDTAHERKCIVFIPNGVYFVGSPSLLPDGTYILGQSTINARLLSGDRISLLKSMNPVAQGIIIENLFLDCITNNNFTFTSNDIDPLRTAPDTSIGINLLAQTYLIRNVNVQHFTIGILTNPVMTNASDWVNTGENKNVDTCTAGQCSIGFFFDAGDCHSNNIVSAHCFIGVVNSATTGTNYHIWGFDYMGILLRNATSRIVNLQIESDLSNGDVNANGTVSPKDSHLPDGYTRTWIAVQSHAKAFLSRVDMWNVCSSQHAVMIQVLDDSLAIIDNVAVTKPNTGTNFLPVLFWANKEAFVSIASLFIDPRFAVYDKQTHWDIPAVGLVYTTTSSTLDTTSDLRYVQKAINPDMMKTIQLIDATKLQ